MSDYVEQLDNILRATGEEVLTHTGKISHAQAMEKAKADTAMQVDGYSLDVQKAKMKAEHNSAR